MNSFQLYFKLGLQHILDIQGFDHILFVLALCAVYVARDWKKILILVTAFTIGHSLALMIGAYSLFPIPVKWIEILIAISIFII